jgi:hypothetical protein
MGSSNDGRKRFLLSCTSRPEKMKNIRETQTEIISTKKLRKKSTVEENHVQEVREIKRENGAGAWSGRWEQSRGDDWVALAAA